MAKLNPAVAAGRAAVRPALRAAAAASPAPLVLVACSGGADSLALAAAVAFEAPRAQVRAGAVVVDHGLQPGSEQVAGQAAAQCAALGLAPVAVERVRVPQGSADGVEAAARQARYAALERAAGAHGALAVYLGHTLDDQAETVLLALARGAGARALEGMAPVRGIFQRPFLGLSRAQTEAMVAAAGLAAWQDPANLPGGPHPSRRAELRAWAMPALAQTLGPGLPGALARTARRLRQDSDYLDQAAAALLAAATAQAAPAGEPDGRLAGAGAASGGQGGQGGEGGAGGLELDGRLAGAGAASGGQGGEGGEGGLELDGRVAGGGAASGGQGGEGGLELDVRVLAGAHPALRTRALRQAALRAGARPGGLAAAHIDALDALVANWRGQGEANLPGGIRAGRKCGKLVFRAGGGPGPRNTVTGDPGGR
ncbi:MAG: tRNA lysidine(34) synthetase TilS [Bifidobacteriaceae bacterium]|nr:tRNA lysidine(34) synthetase TilS [Bifidobacteriaceae bacterium]